MRALAIVDGEHYPAVVRDALRELPYDFVAAVLVGGREKLRGGDEYGVPLDYDVGAALAEHRPEVVVDLSDEPVLGPVERLALASRVLAYGVPYVGADFRLDPPERRPFALPSIAVVGTGKRVGKTAVTGRLASVLARDRQVVVVAMGRGGPLEPEVISTPPSVDDLLALSRVGRHAASDHLETAALTGVTTVGCRRCGGGLAGGVMTSNVIEGALVAESLAPDLVVFDGSGASLPPIAADRTVVVVGGRQDPAVAAGYLNVYRLLLADLVVTVFENAEGSEARRRMHDHVAAVVRPGVPVVAATLLPRPLADIAGTSVAYFSTAPEDVLPGLTARIEDVFGASIVHASANLANRDALEAELSGVEAEVFLVELKAAAIDVVAEAATSKGARVVLAANDPVAIDAHLDLDELLLEMAKFRP